MDADRTEVKSGHPYSSAAYARALSFLGPALSVPAWGNFVIKRDIPGASVHDASGPYPRMHFPPGADLAGGLEQLRQHELVSVVLIPDPFGGPEPAEFEESFPICRPFKTHHYVDYAVGYSPTKHHRDEIRRGLRRCLIERVNLRDHLEEWTHLYGNLIARHEITGTANFPSSYFDAISAMPAFVAFAAYVGGEVAAMSLWFEHDGVATSHLAAANALGYSNGANYAMNDAAITHFSSGALIDLGGGAGIADDPADGLFRFKQGFANSSKTAFLCGAILDPERYSSLSRGRDQSFFPAYRS